MVYYRTQNSKIFLDGKKPLGQIDIGIDFDNNSVISRKPNDSISQYTGKNNVYVGYQSGFECNRGEENTFVGCKAGFQTNLNTAPG